MKRTPDLAPFVWLRAPGGSALGGAAGLSLRPIATEAALP